MALLMALGMFQLNARSAAYKEAMKKEIRLTATNSRVSAVGRVSTTTIHKFSQNFGLVSNTVWEKCKSLDKVTFDRDGIRMVAYYNSTSKLVGTGAAGDTDGIPLQALADLKTKYKNYAVGYVVFFDGNEANALSKLVYGTHLKEENYLIELTNDKRNVVVKVKVNGGVATFNQI